MENLFSPEVIEAAAKSTLGAFSLMILVLGFIVLVFFRRSPIWAKLVVFVMLFVGVSGYGYSLHISKRNIELTEIESCVVEKITLYESEKLDSSSGGARAKSPGLKGGKNVAVEELCHSIGPNQKIISASTEELSCHGGRCSVTAPEISQDGKKVCVTITAWSESKSFGGGGSGQYRLNVIYKNVATEDEINSFRILCESLVNKNN